MGNIGNGIAFNGRLVIVGTGVKVGQEPRHVREIDAFGGQLFGKLGMYIVFDQKKHAPCEKVIA
jgi:hypothetical protein